MKNLLYKKELRNYSSFLYSRFFHCIYKTFFCTIMIVISTSQDRRNEAANPSCNVTEFLEDAVSVCPAILVFANKIITEPCSVEY